MNVQRGSVYVFALLLGLASAACGGDDNSDNNNPGDGDGDGDAGGGGGDGDAGKDFTLTGEVTPVAGTSVTAQCSETSNSYPTGCYSFYCGTNGNSVKAALAPNAVCGSAGEVFYACEGTITKETSDCARDNALTTDPRAATKACVRKNKDLDVITDPCLDCYLTSADCAREQCISECLAGNSPTCDACRQTKGCTPSFYQCAGLPDPQ